MNLLIEISRACKDHAIAPSLFGRRAVGDPRLYFDLRNGRQPRATTRRRILAFIAGMGRA